MKRLVLGVLAALLGLVGVGLLGFGAVLFNIFGTDGKAILPVGAVQADGRAIVVNDFQIEAPTPLPLQEDWFDLQLEVRGDTSHFVGVAEKKPALRYLQGVAYELVTDLDTSTGQVEGRTIPGDTRPSPPQSAKIFSDSATGPDVVVGWPVTDGQTVLLIMNEDLSPAVAAQIDVVVTVTWTRTAAIAAGVGGLLLVMVALAMLVSASRSPRQE